MYYEVYVDILFLENLWMDAELLVLTAKLFRKPLHAGRILAAAIAGSLGACLLTIGSEWISRAGCFLGSLFLAVLMTAIAFGREKHFRLTVAGLYLECFLMGGFLRYADQFYRLNGMVFLMAGSVAGVVLSGLETLILEKKKDESELPSKIYLFQGLPKQDKMELIVQKAVELGVYQVIPVATKRAVVKLDAKKAKKKVERWQQIAVSAAKQAGRGIIPAVGEVRTYAQALKYAEELDVVLIPYELAEGMEETKQIIAEIRPGQSVGIFIGPEGGFEKEEVEQAVKAGAEPLTLGKRILRTETAGLTMLSVLMFHLEG